MGRMQRAETIAETLTIEAARHGSASSPHRANTGKEIFEKPHPRVANRSCLPSGGCKRLHPGLNGFEQPEAQGVVVAFERDHEAHAPMLAGVGIARQGADTGKGACLEQRALAAA